MNHVKNILPKPLNSTTINYRYGTNPNLVNQLNKSISEASKQTKDVAQWFAGNNTTETCYRIWQWLKTEIRYVPDQHDQEIKMPARFAADGTGDCKSYSLFTASILSNLGIPFKMRYTSYNADPTPSHVYVVTQCGVIVDGTYSFFNRQKEFTFNKDYDMYPIKTLNGIGGTHQVMITGIGDRIRDAINQVISDPKRARRFHILFYSTLLASRLSFRLVVRSNLFGAGYILNRVLQNPEARQKFNLTWYALGGEQGAGKVVADIRKGAERGLPTPKQIKEFEEKILTPSKRLGDPAAAALGSSLPTWVGVLVVLTPLITGTIVALKGGNPNVPERSTLPNYIDYENVFGNGAGTPGQNMTPGAPQQSGFGNLQGILLPLVLVGAALSLS